MDNDLNLGAQLLEQSEQETQSEASKQDTAQSAPSDEELINHLLSLNESEQNADKEDKAKDESDTKALLKQNDEAWQAKFNELQSKFNSLSEKLNKESAQDKAPTNSQREEFLKELGLENIDEKLKELEELKQKDMKAQNLEAMREKFTKAQAEILKAFPDVNLVEINKIAEKLKGLDMAEPSAWKFLITLIRSKASAPDVSVKSSSGSMSAGEFKSKLQKGELSDIDIGKELLSLTGN